MDVAILEAGASLPRLILPGNTRILFGRQPDGTFLNPTISSLRALTDRTGNTLALSRDGQGRVTALTDAVGRQLHVSYTGASLRIDRIQDPLGREVRYTYDSEGRLGTVTDPAGGVTRYTYGAGNRLLTITDPRGIVFLTNAYDSAGRVLRQTQADGGIWTFAYTATGGFVSQTTVTDPRGSTTTSRFNSSGYLISQTDALGQTTTLTRAPGSNLLLSTTDPLGRRTTFTYDAQGNVTTITDPQGHARTLTYDPTFNKVTSITDPLGNLTTFAYDAQGNLIAITDPEQNTRPEADRLKTQITYNSAGQPLTMTDPVGNTTTFTHDPVGNLVAITDPLGNSTTRTYDGASRLLTQADPRGKVTRFAYDALNRLTTLTDPLGGLTQFTYDGNGNLLTVTDARGRVTTQEYDNMDQLSRRIDQLGASETFSHDGNGNLLSTTDRKGQANTFEYDALNRRVRASYADGSATAFVYDAAGRLAGASDSLGAEMVNEYDVLGRLIGETTPNGSIQYTYDALGRRTSMTVAGQSPVSYRYNADSRVTQIVAEPLSPATFAYDAAGRRTLLTFPNGVSTEYQYDAASRISALIYRNALGSLGDLTYSYDAAGNRTRVGGSFARILLPDPVSTALYDPANRQLTFGDKSMSYDANGNLVNITDPSALWTFTWNARDRLAAFTGPASSASFVYDPLGRRSQKVINGEVVQQLFDGPHLVRTTGGSTDSRFVTGPGLDEHLLLDSNRMYLADANGNVIALTDSSGLEVSTYSYEPFGRATHSGELSANPFRFTGRDDDGLGLLYYRSRYYHPSLARFISEDPLGVAGGLNFYAYVGNNPISYADPFGLCRDPGGPGIRYCIETFIPQHQKWGFGGDNRSPDPNGGTFRTHQEIYQTPAGITTSFFRPGESTLQPFAFPLYTTEAVAGASSGRARDLPSGGRKITVSGAASDGVLFGFAPDAYYRLTILETADGHAKVVGPYGTRFPSIEVWQYGGPGSGPRLIYTYDAEAAATGPLDLFSRGPLP